MTQNILKTPQNWLNLDECERLFYDFRHNLDRFESLPDFETRYPNKLEGILGSVEATFDKKPLNVTVLDVAALYFNQIIRGHPFKNGNKRLAVLYTVYYLLTENITLTLTKEELYHFAVAVNNMAQDGKNAEYTKAFCKYIIRGFSKDS